MGEKNFHFRNRVWVQSEKKLKKRLLYGIAIASIIASLIMLVTNGFSAMMLFGLIIAPATIFKAANSLFAASGAYEEVSTYIEIREKDIIVTYDRINRNDGAGLRKEIYHLVEGSIQKLEYSNPLKGIHIVCKPEITIEFFKRAHTTKRNLMNGRETIGIFLYPEQKLKDPLLEQLASFSKCKVDILN